MNIWLRRFSSQSDSTLGLLFINGEFECFTLEDEKRTEKISGETRIPKGIYKVEKRKEISGLTEKYRDRYEFFDYHLMLYDVPNFKYVYMHVGNDDDHTDGCILVGDQVKSNRFDQENNLLSSTNAFKRFYEKVSQTLLTEEVMIKITDDEYL